MNLGQDVTAGGGQARKRRSLIPLAFFLPMAVVVLVNGLLVFFAVSTWQGLVVEKPYEKGLAYNQALERKMRAERLGWSLELGFVPTGAAPGAGEVAARIHGAAGETLPGLAVEARISRPVENLAPIVLELPYRGEGRFAAPVVLPLPGQWDVEIVASNGIDRLDGRRRIFVR
ncbi:MAG: FixH family protein [Alphaproteobacteria bacterium]|nr:FixH family protein [Alphaproteobacteria bacterium]